MALRRAYAQHARVITSSSHQGCGVLRLRAPRCVHMCVRAPRHTCRYASSLTQPVGAASAQTPKPEAPARHPSTSLLRGRQCFAPVSSDPRGIAGARAAHGSSKPSEPPRARGRPRLWSAAVNAPLKRVNARVDETLSELRDGVPSRVSPQLWNVCVDAVTAIHQSPSKQLVRPQLVFLGGSWDVPVGSGSLRLGPAASNEADASSGSDTDGDATAGTEDADAPGGGDAGLAALEKFAAGLELQHLFMMVHDDVIDNATRRRGLPPVHLAARMPGKPGGVRQGASYHLATIVGDVLYTKAMTLMHEASVDAAAPQALTTVLNDGVRTGFGQFCDIVGWNEMQATGFGGDSAMSVVDSILLDKSGLTAMCSPLLAGMHLTGADAGTMAIANQWGRHAGVAMQAIDDVADLVVEQATTGKDSFQDFRDQRLTVLLFLLWDRAGGTSDWRELKALWRGLSPTRGSGDYTALLPHERRSLMHMLERHGVVPAAFDFARTQLDAAEAVLADLPGDRTLAVGLGRFLDGMRAHATALEGIIAEEAEEHGYIPT